MTIKGILVDLGQKLELKTRKTKLNNKTNFPFHVTPQTTSFVNENRKKLFEISEKTQGRGERHESGG